MKVASGFLGLLLGALITLSGLILVLYEEESDGDAYVNVRGTHIDADLIGVPLLVVAVAVIALSLRSLRRSGLP
jgi:uncharacterized protein HemY